MGPPLLISVSTVTFDCSGVHMATMVTEKRCSELGGKNRKVMCCAIYFYKYFFLIKRHLSFEGI